MKITPGHVQGEHVMLTGPIRGNVELADGTLVDVTPAAIDVTGKTPEEIEEIDFLIGQHWVENGHPDDRERDDDEDSPTYGEVVQRPFVVEVPAKFKDHPGRFKGKTAGKARKPVKSGTPKKKG